MFGYILLIVIIGSLIYVSCLIIWYIFKAICRLFAPTNKNTNTSIRNTPQPKEPLKYGKEKALEIIIQDELMNSIIKMSESELFNRCFLWATTGKYEMTLVFKSFIVNDFSLNVEAKHSYNITYFDASKWGYSDNPIWIKYQHKFGSYRINIPVGKCFISTSLGSEFEILENQSIVCIIDYTPERIQAKEEEIENERLERIEQARLKREEEEKEEVKKKLLEKERKRNLEKLALKELEDEGLIFSEASKRPPIPKEVVDVVWNRDGGKCVYCGSQKNLHLDHIIPFSKGGDSSVENLQILCQECNLKKSNKIG